MLLDIQMVKTYDMFCEESALASIAGWKNRHYQLMFLDMLGFDFNYEAAIRDNNLGNHLSSGYNLQNVRQLAECFHGIQSNLLKYSGVGNLSELLLQELKKNMPVGLYFNESYSKSLQGTANTFLLIIGYEDDIFYCYNIHANITDIKNVSKDEIDTFTKENEFVRYITYELKEEEQKNITYDTFVNYINQSDYVKKNGYQQIIQMADFMEHRLCLEKEIREENVTRSPILAVLLDIIRGRRLLSLSLEYIYTLDKNPLILSCKDDILEIAADWKNQYLALYKMCVLKMWKNDEKYKTTITSIADEIRKIASKEHRLFSNLYAVNSETCNKVIKYKCNDIINEESVYDIDISHYYNNKAFLIQSKKDVKADISGFSEYFTIDQDSIKIKTYGLELNLELGVENYDNISCTGQRLELSSMKCSKLLVITLAEWGKAETSLLLHTNSGELIKLELEVEDWYVTNFDDRIVWTGDAHTVTNSKDTRGLFGYLYDFGSEMDINCIVLPQKPNLHIFKMIAIDETKL